jgi:hypothetical protein
MKSAALAKWNHACARAGESEKARARETRLRNNTVRAKGARVLKKYPHVISVALSLYSRDTRALTFDDYICLHADARREERDGRSWLPPLIRYKEENGWGCSFIEPGDYDTGHFDDLFILLELNIPPVPIEP